ncbi:hypothetical protein L0F63_004125 [Massospora cicadina]|nr:hypothetical protein L0F63_004125 [Massospora cicadina]
METYPKLRKDGISFSEASKIISQKYKELSTAELGALKSRAAAETEILAKKYTAWMNSLSTAQIAKYNAYLKKKGKKGKVVDPERPKRPISAYIMFSLDNQKLPEYEGLSMLEKSRLLSKKWAELSPALKKKYKDLQVKRFAEYARLSEAFSKKLSV